VLFGNLEEAGIANGGSFHEIDSAAQQIFKSKHQTKIPL
jgi:hypothetical protein